MSRQTRREATCAGIVPTQHAALFAEELRAAFPGKEVTLSFGFHDAAVELWVAPGLRDFELARWNRRWLQLRDALTAPTTAQA